MGFETHSEHEPPQTFAHGPGCLVARGRRPSREAAAVVRSRVCGRAVRLACWPLRRRWRTHACMFAAFPGPICCTRCLRLHWAPPAATSCSSPTRQAAEPPRRVCLCAFLSPSYLSIPWRRSSRGLRAHPASTCAPAPGPSRFFFALAHCARTHRYYSLNLARTLARPPAPACCYPRCGRCWMGDIFWCC